MGFAANNLLGWLRQIGKPWFGSWRDSDEARRAIGHDQVRSRLVGALGKIRFPPYMGSITEETAEHRRYYRRMLAEPVVKAALLEKVMAVAALDLSVTPGGDGDDPRNKKAADFGLHYINSITSGDFGLSGLPAIAETVLLPGLIFGFSVSEKVFDVETRGKWQGKAILKHLKGKDTENEINLEVDEFNNIVSLVGVGANSGHHFDPASFVIWRHLSIFNTPAGMSDLRAAYRAWFSKDVATTLRMIYLEKFAAGPMLLGTYTDPGRQKEELAAALEAAKASTWIAIPEGARAEALNLAARGTADFEAAIEKFDREIMIAITGAVLQALEGTTTDGRGSSSIHKTTSDLRKWHLKACMESILNTQILRDAIDLNFVGVEYPQAVLGGIDDAEMAASLAIDVGLSRDLRLPLSRRDLHKRYGRPLPADTADAVEPMVSGTPGQSGMPFSEPAKEAPAEPFCEHRSSWGYRFRRG